MQEIAATTPCANSTEPKKYERRISKVALIRRFAKGDYAVTQAAIQYIQRFTSAPQTLWLAEDGPWIAQPLRCFSEELDLPMRTLTEMHDRMVSLGMFEIVARKLYPSAMRNTTHVRPTGVFRLYLHQMNWWPLPASEAAALKLQHGQELATLAVDRQCTYAVGRTLMENTQGTQIKPSGSKLPAPAATGHQDETQCNQLHSTPAEKATPMPIPDKAFKGGASPNPPKKPQASMTVLQAAQTVIDKKHLPPGAFPKAKGPQTASGLWAKVAGLVRSATQEPFPLMAPAMQMARLATLRKSMIAEYDTEDSFWDMIAAAVGDWDSFREWMLANSTLAKPKTTPETVDVLWLQFHRQKAYEYARGPGKEIAASVRSGKPLTQAQGAPSTAPASKFKIID